MCIIHFNLLKGGKFKMNNSEFYNSIKLIVDHKNTVALININEFKRLKRINGEYKWVPFKIGKLPAIPIKTSDFQEIFRATNEMVNIRITPIWTFLTNGKQVITPKIETFELTEFSKLKTHYSLSRKFTPNPHYLSNSTWNNIFDKAEAKRENAIEWNKTSRSSLLPKTDDNTLQIFLTQYQKELEFFGQLYEESANVAEKLRIYQKRLR